MSINNIMHYFNNWEYNDNLWLYFRNSSNCIVIYNIINKLVLNKIINSKNLIWTIFDFFYYTEYFFYDIVLKTEIELNITYKNKFYYTAK